ncbi:MAG TPA: hypothetical protein VKR06_02020 [Ktedonosporobacter sp.]|nr:hypothetical protein [Ktedonosporobacter sp.]
MVKNNYRCRAITPTAEEAQKVKQAELETTSKAQEIKRAEDRAGYKQQMNQLELEKQQLALELQRLEVEKQRVAALEQRLEAQKKGIEYALEIAGKMVTIVHPQADPETRTLLMRTLLPQLLQLENGKGIRVSVAASSAAERGEARIVPIVLRLTLSSLFYQGRSLLTAFSECRS